MSPSKEPTLESPVAADGSQTLGKKEERGHAWKQGEEQVLPKVCDMVRAVRWCPDVHGRTSWASSSLGLCSQFFCRPLIKYVRHLREKKLTPNYVNHADNRRNRSPYYCEGSRRRRSLQLGWKVGAYIDLSYPAMLKVRPVHIFLPRLAWRRFMANCPTLLDANRCFTRPSLSSWFVAHAPCLTCSV